MFYWSYRHLGSLKLQFLKPSKKILDPTTDFPCEIIKLSVATVVNIFKDLDIILVVYSHQTPAKFLFMWRQYWSISTIGSSEESFIDSVYSSIIHIYEWVQIIVLLKPQDTFSRHFTSFLYLIAIIYSIYRSMVLSFRNISGARGNPPSPHPPSPTGPPHSFPICGKKKYIYIEKLNC